MMPALTIGVIYSRRTEGEASLRALLRLLRDNPSSSDVELLLVGSDSEKAVNWAKKQVGARFVRADPDRSTATLDTLFAEANGEFVLVLEGPIRLKRGALAALLAHYEAFPDTRDLIHGPLMRGKRVIATHSKPRWKLRSWGERARDARGLNPDGEPFVIPMQESGVYSCRRDAWPGLSPGWRGHGGEPGYLQERFRRRGGQVLCLPGLRWKRVTEPAAIPPRSPEALALLRNHFVGAADLDFDTGYIALKFQDALAPGEARKLRSEVLHEREPEAPLCSPLVSCLLYADRLVPDRQSLLEEAIESFLRQDYPRKELILLNDAPEQFLVCELPGVRVINTSSRCPSLGDCFNVAAAFAQGELLAPWSGTAINLPWRLSLSVANLGADAVYRPDVCWYMLDGDLDDRSAQPDGGQVALLTRDAYRSVGGYPSITLGLHREMDAALDAWLEATGRPRQAQTLPQERWFTIIRRRQVDARYSGDPFLDPWQAAGQLRVQSGRFVLRPRWKIDYVARCRERLAMETDENPAAPMPAVPYVLGRRRGRLEHWIPRLDLEPGQTTAQHLLRVAAYLQAAADAGGSHLVIPPAEATWLSQHPHVAEYLTSHFWLLDAGAEPGFIFALRNPATDQRGSQAGTARV